MLKCVLSKSDQPKLKVRNSPINSNLNFEGIKENRKIS